MSTYTKLPAAGLLFFLSAWMLMIFAGTLSRGTGIRPFGYGTAMIATIGLWLVVAPAIGAVGGKAKP